MRCSPLGPSVLATILLAANPVLAAPPEAAKHPVTDTFWGETVTEDYRWLEDWGDANVRTWSEAKNGEARAFLDSLPMRDAILDRLEALTHTLTPDYRQVKLAGGRYFAIKDQPPRQQPVIVTLPSLMSRRGEKLLVDPMVLDPSGLTSIDFYVPSPDGHYVAVSMSKAGTEEGTVRVWDTTTGQKLEDEVPRVNRGTGGGAVAWSPQVTGFYRTRYPAPGERAPGDDNFYLEVWFHRLGMPENADTYVLGKGFPRIAELSFDPSGDGQWVTVEMRNGDGGEKAFWLLDPTGIPHRVSRIEDEIAFARAEGDRLFLLSRARSLNGEILSVPLKNPVLAEAKTVVAAGDRAIEWFESAQDRLWVEDIDGGPSRMRMFTLDGEPLGDLPLPSMCTVRGLLPLKGGAVAFQRESYTEPAAWWRYDLKSGKITPTALATHSPADFSDVEVSRENAMSKDGTAVPVTILRRKSTRLGPQTPFHLYAYGGYGISQRPNFSATRRLWLEQGGAMAIAHIRGGGEKGEAWHRAGSLTHKQKDYDDFQAAAQLLLDKGWTVPGKLAIEGGSNGGLLMGASLTQFPDKFGAVVSRAGVYDMLRVERSPNGEYNITEYGTVKDSAQYRALRGYSPVHNVKDGVAYPPVLFTTGANDPRVDPMHSRKMIARLQAASTSGQPMLLRTSATAGHGAGAPRSARNALTADTWSFVFDRLGVPYKPVAQKVAARGPKLAPSKEKPGTATGSKP